MESNNFSKIYRTQTDDGQQFINTYNNLNERMINSDVVVYGENDSNYNLIGIQQTIVEYLVSQGLKASYLGDRLRGTTARLAYRASGFIDSSSLSAVVDSFGINSVTGISQTQAQSTLIPSNNIQTSLYVSSPIVNPTYSALFFKKQTGYIGINGYDFSNQYFYYFAPITTSPSITVNVGSKVQP